MMKHHINYLSKVSAITAVASILFVPLLVFGQETPAAGDGDDTAIGWIGSTLMSMLWYLVISVFGFFTSVAGNVLDAGINTFVVEFGDQYIGSGLGFVIDSLWVVVRDFFNLTFIFGLVYIGFKMILRSDDSNTRRWLVMLIVAALLVNFSLFFTKVIIDFSNLLATQIVQDGFGECPTWPSDPERCPYRYGVSIYFLQASGITTILDADVAGEREGLPGNIADSWNGFTYIFGTAFLLTIMTFVFFAGGLMLLIRFVVLNMYMLLSPFMFIGFVFPPLQRYTSQYWKGFLSRAFFAPIFLFLVYFSFRILNEWRSIAGNADFGGMLTGEGDVVLSNFAATFIPFLLVAIFLLASVVIAQKIGVDGASTALRVGDRARRRSQAYIQRQAGNASFGMAARAGRATAGTGAYAVSQGNNRVARGLKATAAKGGITGYAAKTTLRAADKTADSSFDARNVGGLGKEMGIGTGRKGGVKSIAEERKKRDDGMLKLIGTRDTTTPEAQQEIANNAEAIKQGAENDRQNVGTMKSTLETDKTKDSGTLRSEINALDTQLATLKLELEDDKQKGVVTPNEIKDREKVIQAAEVKIEQKRQLEDNKKKTETRKSRITEIDTEIASTTDEKQKAELRTEREKLVGEVDRYEKVVDENIANMENAVKAAEKRMQAAPKIATAEYKYQDRINYLKNMERSSAFWRNPATGALGSVGAANAGTFGATGFAAGGATALTAGGGAGLGFAAAAQQEALISNSVRKALEKQWGADALEMAEKDRKNKDEERLFKALNEKLKEGDASGEKSSDDKKDDD